MLQKQLENVCNDIFIVEEMQNSFAEEFYDYLEEYLYCSSYFYGLGEIVLTKEMFMAQLHMQMLDKDYEHSYYAVYDKEIKRYIGYIVQNRFGCELRFMPRPQKYEELADIVVKYTSAFLCDHTVRYIKFTFTRNEHHFLKPLQKNFDFQLIKRRKLINEVGEYTDYFDYIIFNENYNQAYTADDYGWDMK